MGTWNDKGRFVMYDGKCWYLFQPNIYIVSHFPSSASTLRRLSDVVHVCTRFDNQCRASGFPMQGLESGRERERENKHFEDVKSIVETVRLNIEHLKWASETFIKQQCQTEMESDRRWEGSREKNSIDFTFTISARRSGYQNVRKNKQNNARDKDGWKYIFVRKK